MLVDMFSFNPAFLNGLPYFAIYALTALVMSVLFLAIYNKVTPYCEWKLIKEHQNLAAAWAYGGAFIGFCIPMAQAIKSSQNVVDFMIWGVIAMMVQFFVFWLVQKPMPKLKERIINNEVQAGTLLAMFSIGAGLLNAACMHS